MRLIAILPAFFLATVLLSACGRNEAARLSVAESTAAALPAAAQQARGVSAAADTAGQPTITVYKSPTCGCCTEWEEHLRANGMKVISVRTGDLASVKVRHGIPARLESCHTGVVDGYLVEGHVPAAEVRRLLATRPAVSGIAVPGMPLGSPGMDAYGRTEKYDVISFDSTGRTAVFARY